MDLIRAMETFVGVVDHGGFAAASRELGQSKAQVSRTISALEDHLGIRLMQRSTRRSSLTEEGHRYLQHSREILDENARVEEELGERRIVPRGRLKINGPLSWGERHLGPLLPGFMQRYPEIKVDVTLTDRFVDLLEEGFDVALRIGGDPHSSLVGRKLGTVRHGIFASRDYLKHSPKLDNAKDFKAHKCLAYVLSGEVRPWTFRDEQFVPDPTMATNNGDILRTAALEGAGITMLPTFFVEDDLVSGKLVDLTGDCPTNSKDLYLPIMAVYPERRHLSPKVRVLVDYLVDALAEVE